MAIVNPDPQPVQDPLYIGYSKPIEQPKPDLSSATLLKTAGDVFETGVQDADKLVKKSLDDNIHSEIDKERDAYTESLVQGADIARGADPQNVPPALNNLSPTLSNLGGARANGKLSETDYFGRLDTLAKDFRSRYPGYRDYIDQQFEKVTGVTPANARIKSLIGDINSFTTNARSEREKDINVIREKVKEGKLSPPTLDAVEKGTITPIDAMNISYPRDAAEAQFKYNAASLSDFKGTREAKGIIADQVFTDKFNKQNSDIAYEMLVSTGFLGRSAPAQMKLKDLISGLDSGRYKIDDANAGQVADMIQGLRTKAYARSWADANAPLDPKNPNSDTYATLVGTKPAQEKIEASLAMLDKIAGDFRSKDYGWGSANARMNASMGHDDLAKALRIDQAGILRGMNAIQHLGPINSKVLGDYLASQGDKVSSQLLGVFGQLVTPFNPRILPGAVGAGAPVNPAAFYTMKDALDTAKRNGWSNEASNKVVNWPTQVLLDPGVPDENKVGALHALFDPRNNDNIMRLSKDGVDAKGREIPGNHVVYTTWYSPAVTAKVRQLSQADFPLWNEYRNSAVTSFNKLAQSDLLDLNNIQKSGQFEISYTTDKSGRPRFDAHYNPTGNDPNKAPFMSTSQAAAGAEPVRQHIQQNLDRLNNIMTSLHEVVKQDSNGDPNATNATMMKLLRGMGLNEKSMGVPGSMFRAVKSLGYADESEEGSKGSLKEFLKDPARGTPRSKNNAPAASARTPTGNVGDILGIQVDDIPEGMSARDFLQQLKAQGR